MEISILEGVITPLSDPLPDDMFLVPPLRMVDDPAELLGVRMAPSDALPFEEFDGDGVMFLAIQTTDSTLMFTQAAVAEIVDAAEHWTREQGGRWVAGSVRVLGHARGRGWREVSALPVRRAA